MAISGLNHLQGDIIDNLYIPDSPNVVGEVAYSAGVSGLNPDQGDIVPNFKAILAKYLGSLYVPSPSSVFQDSAGTIAGAVDQPVGKLLDLIGTNHALQGTPGFCPILRGKVKNFIKNTSFAGAIAGSPGTAPTNWTLPNAPAGVTRTTSTGTTADGKAYIDIRLAGTNTSGAVAYIATGTTSMLAVSGLTVTAAFDVALMAGAWPTTSCTVQITELDSGLNYLASSGSNVKPNVTGSALVRQSHTRTLNQATCTYARALFQTPIAIGETVDFTYRIACPQIELGAVANPFVATTTSAAASSSYGPYWLDFDGVNDRLQLTSVPFQLQDSPFVVAGYMPLSVAVQRNVFTAYSAGSSRTTLYTNITTGTRTNACVDDAGVAAYPTDSTTSALGIKSVSAFRNSTGAKALRTNGVQRATSSIAQGNTTHTLTLIGSGPSGSSPFNGPIYSIALGKGAITDSELLQIERYVGQLSGVTI